MLTLLATSVSDDEVEEVRDRLEILNTALRGESMSALALVSTEVVS